MIRLFISGLLLIVLVFQNIFAQSAPSSSSDTHKKSFKTFKDCSECPEMVIIPAGHFMMGAPIDESGRYSEEGPQHQVSISRFAAGEFDITLGEWKAFVAATNHTISGGCAWSALPADSAHKPWDLNPSANWSNLGFPQNDQHPVVCISWNDIQDYLSWLSMKTGNKYRLLTEAEWEYAARAGTTTPFPWGSTATHEFANYGKDTCCGGLASGRDQWIYTSPVGSFPPNAFGLYDMNGNVLQYVEDCFALYNQGLPKDGSAFEVDAPLKMTGDLVDMNEKNSCSFRMVRGGDWGDPPKMIRSSYRNWSPGPGITLKDYRSTGLGFRVAKSL
jgi:formylglycine-generating enzyme required for sulfatase activity